MGTIVRGFGRSLGGGGGGNGSDHLHVFPPAQWSRAQSLTWKVSFSACVAFSVALFFLLALYPASSEMEVCLSNKTGQVLDP